MASITEIGAASQNPFNQTRFQNPDYNYRSLNRKDLMSLSTITNEDTKVKKFKQVDTNRDWSTNLYNLDIDGSVPKKFGVLNQKVDYINKVDDIERSSSKIINYPLKKPEYNLNCKDIEGAYPQCNTLFVTTRVTDPLQPKYQISKVEHLDPPVPKFIRDNINVDGIEGAKPRKYFQWETRKMFDTSGILGSSPKRPYIRNSNYSNLDYSDVTHDKFQTKRCVDPLDPVYLVEYGKGDSYTHGQIEGSKPTTFSKYNYLNPLNLKTSDIEGTSIGSKNRIRKFQGENFHLNIKDIRGASAGSLKKGIITDRKTNPLVPNYGVYFNEYDPYGDFKKVETSGPKKVEKEDKNKELNYLKESIKESTVNREDKSNSLAEHENKEVKLPAEILGFNNQYYIDDRPNFYPDKFQKPKPFYGFAHDQYLISANPVSNSSKHQQFRNSGKSTHKPSQSDKFKATDNNNYSASNQNQNKSSKFNDYAKQSYAQMLDKFIQKNPSLD